MGLKTKLIWSVVIAFLASSILFAGAGQDNGRHGRIRVKPLRPTADTDVVLDEILLTQDDMGRRRLVMGGPLEKGVRERLFWLADPATGRYHVLRLTGNHIADAKRIQKVYRNFGGDAADQDVADLLETDYGVQDERIRRYREKATGQPSRQARQRPQQTMPGYRLLRVADGLSQKQRPLVIRPLSSAGGDDCSGGEEVLRSRLRTVQWVESCAGYGYADVQTWEPARFVVNVDHLNETWTGAWWNRYDYSIYGLAPYGFCWANPQTFAFTHWYTLFCQPHGSFYGNGFDSSWTGLYFNIDFLWEVLGIPYFPPIYVTSTASVQYVNGFPNWGAQHYVDASGLAQYIGDYFLTGIITGEAYEYSCSWNCAPDGNLLIQCNQTGYWDYQICECISENTSPIIIDLAGDGLKLTDPEAGVSFDLLADGRPVHTAWTQPGSEDAFLALDRNHNGIIDDGAELFGNVTPQPVSAKKASKKNAPNGFLALSVFDDPANGGNADGMITEDDAIYRSLLLWVDANHDGVSQPEELRSLADSGVRAISLHYVVGKKVDEFGNVYRFRSHALMDRDILDHGSIERRAIDVLLKIN